ncbi:MAG: hypothetical protein WD557_18240 [Dehalococcoidia bacterium]
MRLFKRGTAEHADASVGGPVFTSDNHAVGQIKEVQEGGFLVDVTMGKDYWLADRDVRSNGEEGVVLAFTEAELEDYKRESAPPETVPEGLPYTTVAIITDEEQMQTRERMERELAEQRQKLHDN